MTTRLGDRRIGRLRAIAGIRGKDFGGIVPFLASIEASSGLSSMDDLGMSRRRQDGHGSQLMSRHVILTLTGADRIGIVEELTRILLDRGGNVETSRMARLGGEFAVLMLVSLPESQAGDLHQGLEGLAARDYKLTITPTDRPYAEAHPGWRGYRIEVEGADHEGIVHRIARYLSTQGISIESMETETASAPFGGVPLFNMAASVAVPPDLATTSWSEGLLSIGNEMNLDVRVAPEAQD
jgi:glycine cleavage system transcriptional repressor